MIDTIAVMVLLKGQARVLLQLLTKAD